MRLLLLAACTLAGVSPVQKVLELLDQLKGKVEADLANEAKLMEEFGGYCDSERNVKEDAITSNKRTVTDLGATIQDAKAKVSTLTAETEELADKIAGEDEDLAGATKVRQAEKKDFEAREKELVDTVDTLERAVIVLKRGQTFLQKPGNTTNLDMLTMGLSQIVEASWVDQKDRAALQSFLQGQDEDLQLQPQATTAAYESKGGSIILTLEEMKSKAQDALSSARKQEMQQAHAYAMLEQSLTTSTAEKKSRMQEAQSERSAAAETQSTAEGDLSATQGTLKTDQAALAELKETCATKQEEWGRRQKGVAEEVAAINKAKEILAGGVKTFFAVSVHTVRRHVSELEQTKRDKVSSLLQGLVHKEHSFMLSQVLQSIRADPFGKVRGLIEDMLERLLKQAGEEADAKSFCDTEMAKSKKKQADLTADADRHAVRIEKAAAGKAKLEEEIKRLDKEVSELDASTAEATALRNAEHDEYMRASAEYKESAEAVANAMQALQDYYATASLLQTGYNLRQPEFGAAKTDVASTIISMLEVAEADFTKLLAEAEAEEQGAVAAFEKLSQENKVAKAAKQAAAKGKAGEVKSLELNLLNYKVDHESTSKELDAILAYLDKLKPQCEVKVMSYAERMQRREEEIAGLKEALTILEG